MPDIKEKLVALLSQVQNNGFVQGDHVLHYENTSNSSVADHLIANGVTIQKWISVEDRLPELEKTVLIRCRSQFSQFGYVCCGFYVPEGTYREDSEYNWDYECCNEYDEEKDDYIVNAGWYEAIRNWDDYNAVGVADIVTHWMPLPEPPKGE